MSKLLIKVRFDSYYKKLLSQMAASGEEVFMDINYSNVCQDTSDKYFHTIIGCIEDTLMEDKFVQIHNNFMEEHWLCFDDDEENKLIYMDIFKKYNETIEKYIVDQLILRVENFDMTRLENELKARQNELDGEIFEILSTFTDFVAFKEKFLDYKAMKEGKVADLSKEFVVSKYCVESEN